MSSYQKLSEKTYNTLLKELGHTWDDIQDHFECAFFQADILVRAKARTLICGLVAIEVDIKGDTIRVSELHAPLKSGDLYIDPHSKILSMVP